MPTKVQLTGGDFQDFEGNVLANGYLLMKLNQDELITGVGQICSGIEVRIELDANGDIDQSPAQYVWGNDQMSPANSYYRVRGYDSRGQLAWGPNNQQVTGSGATFDVGTWVPNTVFSWTPPIQPLEIQTNGVDNGSQTLQNLKDGTGISIVDDGVGGVTITNSAPAATLNFREWKAKGDNTGTAFSSTGFGALPVGVSVSSLANVAPTATEPPMVQLNEGGANPVVVLWDGTTGPIYPISYGVFSLLKMRLQFALQTTGTWRHWYGLSNGYGATLQANDPKTSKTIAFRYIRGVDTVWKAYVSDGTNSSAVSTGIAVDANPHTFQIQKNGSSIDFYIDGVLVANVAANIPTAASLFWPITQQEWSGGLYSLQVGAVYWELSVGF